MMCINNWAGPDLDNTTMPPHEAWIITTKKKKKSRVSGPNLEIKDAHNIPLNEDVEPLYTLLSHTKTQKITVSDAVAMLDNIKNY